MNLYFLVEGRRTEMRLYPRWLVHLLPHFVRVAHPDEATANCYFLISGEGYPRLLDVQLPHAIEDVNAVEGRYDYLVLCLDADEGSVAERMAEVRQHLDAQEPKLTPSTTLMAIVQNRCIETWLLGNRIVFKQHPGSRRLLDYIGHHDVRVNDPEQMGVYSGFDTHAEFHLAYLQEIFLERNLRYSKNSPGHAGDSAYLDELVKRTEEQAGDLLSFQVFLRLCRNVNELTSTP